MANQQRTKISLKYDQKQSVVILAVICCLLWGTAFPILKISYQELGLQPNDIFSKMVFAGLRFLLAGMIVFIYYFIKNKKIPEMNKRSIMPFIIFGLLNTTIQYFFFYTGVANTTAIKGVLLDTSKPLIVVIIAHFIYKNDRINLNKALGIILGFTGIILVNMSKIGGGGLALNFSVYGEGFLIISSIASAFAVIYGKKISKIYDPTVMNCYQFLFGSVVLLGVGLIAKGGFHLKFNALALVLLIFSALVSAIAFVIWYNLLKHNKATTVTIYIFLIPIFGTMISSIVLPNEILNINIIISLVLSATGIYLVNKNSKEVLNFENDI
ncbi:MAG: EamA/RhaT family transporter [Firmicutes bacterium HGW-Firmicutes-1]|jgi:drug/metabolite transporter (DMT)-like permease|nr:MAG: EamA/RhaT family transporter [Firmicutes bacterium HGW-Firmicutes-1]